MIPKIGFRANLFTQVLISNKFVIFIPEGVVRCGVLEFQAVMKLLDDLRYALSVAFISDPACTSD